MTAGKHHLDAATKYARTARIPHIRPPLTVKAWLGKEYDKAASGLYPHTYRTG